MNKKIIATGISAFLICWSLFISEANAIQYTIQWNSTSVEGDFNSWIEINRWDNSSDYCENSCNHSYTNSWEYTITIDSTNAEKILELDLSNANITNIINMSWATNITYLNLKNNKINHIENNAFEGSIFKNWKRIAYQRNWTSYTETDKSCQRWEQWVDEICYDKSSRTINLSNNELKEIPEMFNNDDRYWENPQVYRTEVILSDNLSNSYTHPSYRVSHWLSDPPRIVNLKNNPITLLTPPVEITKEKACFYNGPYHRSEPFDCEFFTRNYNSENPNILSKYTLKDPLGGIFTGETSGVLTGWVREFGISPFHSTEDDKNNVAHRINWEYTLSIEILSWDDIIASRSDTFNIEFATLRIISPYENQTINYNIHDRDAWLDFELQLRREKMTESRLPSPSFNCEITINNSNYNCELSKLPTGPYYYEDYEIWIFLKDNLDNPRQLLTPEGTWQIKVSLKNRRGETVTGDTFNFKYTTLYSVTLDNQEATTPGTEKYYYKFNTTGSTPDGTAVYYWQNEACTDSLLQIEIPTKSGYIFDWYYTDINGSGTQYIDSSGHYINNLRKTVTWDTTLYAKWNSETTYTINHLKQNIDLTDYDLAESETFTWIVDDEITPSTKTYTGFTSPNTQSGTILSWGLLTINYYYTRNRYTVTYDSNGWTPIADTGILFEATIPTPTPSKNWFTFNGWSGLPTSGLMPANDIILTADWNANSWGGWWGNTETTYTVTITPYPTSYWSVSHTSVTANSGTTISTSWNTLTIGSSDVVASPNTPTTMLTSYSFSWWINNCWNSLIWNCEIVAEFKKNSQATWGTYTWTIFTWAERTWTTHSWTTRQYTVTITSSNTGYWTVSLESVTADFLSKISTSENILTIGSTDVIANPSESTTLYTYSFSGRINNCWDTLTKTCSIIADFAKNTNQGNGNNSGTNWSSSSSSSNNWYSGKSHYTDEDKKNTNNNSISQESSTKTETKQTETSQTIQSQNSIKYISRSCKPYNIEYIPELNAYTSPDLKKKEYFVNIEYFKRYVDSKNAQNAECYVTNRSRITKSYIDTSNSNNRFVAPNWKIYFINQQNWFYRSSNINSSKNFTTIDELKNYIKKRNPLIPM